MEMITRYQQIINEKLDLIQRDQQAALEQAKDLLKKAIREDRLIHIFGTGHSHALAEEMFFRAGGLACSNAMLEEPLMVHISATAASKMERQEGYAPIILDKYGVQPGDVMVVVSNSGINAVPVEMAMAARAKGVTTIALTSMAHSTSQQPRNAAGKRLYEVCDLALDALAPVGDATTELPDGQRIAPISSIMGAILLNGIFAQAAAELAGEGFEPPVYTSANVAGGDEKNRALLDRYRGRVRHL